MKRYCKRAAAGLLIAGLAACGGDAQRVDLISAFDTVQKRPDPSLFTISDVTLNNETKRAVSIAPAVGTRLTWKVRVPEDGWLNVAVGLKPEAWEQEGNGVLFLVGVSDGRSYDTLFTQHVNPFGAPADRRWIPVWVDVSAYGGEEIEVILNTYASPPNQPGDMRNDLALWADPAIITR